MKPLNITTEPLAVTLGLFERAYRGLGSAVVDALGRHLCKLQVVLFLADLERNAPSAPWSKPLRDLSPLALETLAGQRQLLLSRLRAFLGLRLETDTDTEVHIWTTLAHLYRLEGADHDAELAEDMAERCA